MENPVFSIKKEENLILYLYYYGRDFEIYEMYWLTVMSNSSTISIEVWSWYQIRK